MDSDKDDLRDILWANVVTLMQREWGGENLTRLGRETGINVGGAIRLKDGETSVRIAMLSQIARVFHVEPWQLVAPGLGEHLYVIDAEHRLAPVYQPGNVRHLPERPSGGLRKTAEQKDRYAARTKSAPARKSGRTAA